MNIAKKSGYILVMTMMMMAALSAIVVYIVHRGSAAVPVAALFVRKEKARMIADSAVEVARSIIATSLPPASATKEPKEAGAEQKQQSHELLLLQKLLPYLNRSSSFALKKAIDGIDGQLQFCITCEEGKINLNNIYDFKNKKFLHETATGGGWKQFVQTVLKYVEKSTRTSGLFDGLEAFLKAQKGPLEDISHLLTIPAFAPLRPHLFFDPSVLQTKDQAVCALTDLFTLYGETEFIEPWLLSATLLSACGIGYDGTISFQTREKSIPVWTKQFKINAQWPADWSATGKVLYEKEFATLPKGIEQFFARTFAPRFFGVWAQGTVEGVTHRVYVIIERVRRSHNNQIVYDSVVRKWYIL